MKKGVLLIIFLLLPVFLFAGTSGKIAGRVIDASTGAPLPGANVRVVETTMGASTDADGYYFIINVPPGVYELNVTMMGYRPKTITNVKVNIDLTTTVNFTLESTVIELGEVVVVAERPMIELDVTSGTARISSDVIERLPSEEFHDILIKKAGIGTGAGGEMHIRGGRSDETAYIVDGVSVVNPFTHGIAAYVPNNAIQQMEVISGAFNAEYGKAMSGVVNIVTKEGRSKLSGTISAYAGDYLSSHKDTFWDIDKYTPFSLSNFSPFDTKFNVKGISNFEASLSGPIPLFGDKLTFFLAGKLFKEEGWIRGKRIYFTSDTVAYPGGFPPPGTEVPDTIITIDTTITLDTLLNDTTVVIDTSTTIQNYYSGDGKIVSMNPVIERSINGKLSLKITPNLKVTWSHFWRNRNHKLYSHSYTYVPDALLNRSINSSQDIFTLTHAISTNTFYTFSGSYSFYNYEYYLYEDPGDPNYHYDDRYYSGVRYTRGGCPHSWFKRNSSTITSKFDVTSQINKQNQIKAGIEGKAHKLYYYSMWIEPANPYNPTHPLNWDEYIREPIEGAAYIQDKIELTQIIINAGIRYDYFDPKSDVPVSDTSIRVISPGNLNPSPAETKLATPKGQLSPRLGIAFPISDRGAFHFSYGHFFQMPTVGYLYANPNFEVRSQHNITTMGNADLKPQKTVIYEAGFKQQVTDDFAFDFTAFQKDIRNLLTTQKVSANPPVDTDIYFKYVNRDYGYVKGVTLSLEKRLSHFWGGSFDYTYQVAEANNASPTTVYASQSGNVDIKRPNQVIPLPWNQTHVLNVALILSDPTKWNISLVGSYGSGRPYTPTDAGGVRIGDENSAMKPAQYNIDLKAYHRFRLRRFTYSLFLNIYNLLDRLNENYVYDDTGRAGYTHTYDRYGEGGVDPGYALRPNYYSKPRTFRFGIEIRF